MTIDYTGMGLEPLAAHHAKLLIELLYTRNLVLLIFQFDFCAFKSNLFMCLITNWIYNPITKKIFYNKII